MAAGWLLFVLSASVVRALQSSTYSRRQRRRTNSYTSTTTTRLWYVQCGLEYDVWEDRIEHIEGQGGEEEGMNWLAGDKKKSPKLIKFRRYHC